MKDDLEIIAEGIFTNAVNNLGRNLFRGVNNQADKALNAYGERDDKGRFKRNGKFVKEPWFTKLYNTLEGGVEKAINVGSGLIGSGLDEEMPQLKAKMYYIVLRQQPPVGTAFKRKLQTMIFNCKSINDLDQLASAYGVYWQWQRYKDYLQQHSR